MKYYKLADHVITELQLGLVKLHTKIMFQIGTGNMDEFGLPEMVWAKTTVGLVKVYDISGILPDYVLNKSGIKRLMNEVIDSHDDATEVITLLQNHFFESATLSGLSLSLKDLSKTEYQQRLLDKASEVTSDMEKECESEEEREELDKAKLVVWDTAINKAVDNWFEVTDPKNPMMVMGNAGARVTPTQVRQMIVCKGLLTEMDGTLSKIPVLKSLSEGLDVLSYVRTVGPARKGLAANNFLVPASGYLCRQLVNLARELIICEEDCGTSDSIIIRGDKYAIGRYTPSGGYISIDNFSDKEHWEVRSPTTCKSSSGLCNRCCGDNIATGKGWNIGTGIGVIAAQSLGEPTTQLGLRGKHGSGSVTIYEHENSLESALSSLLKVIGADSGSIEVKVADSTGPELSDFEGEYRDKVVQVIEYISSLYISCGINTSRVWYEIILRAMSDVYKCEDGEVLLRSRMVGDVEEPQIRGLRSSISYYPSWLKQLGHGHSKRTITKALNSLSSTLDLPSERLMTGYTGE